MFTRRELKALKSKCKSNLYFKDRAIGEISLHIKVGIFYYGGSKKAQYFQLQNPHNWHKKARKWGRRTQKKQSFWKLSNSPEGFISSCKTRDKSQHQRDRRGGEPLGQCGEAPTPAEGHSQRYTSESFDIQWKIIKAVSSNDYTRSMGYRLLRNESCSLESHGAKVHKMHS